MGMWNLVKGSPSQEAVVQLPKAYSDHRPLGPPACLLTSHWSQGPSPKPVCCLSLQEDQPFLRDSGSVGDTPILSFLLILEQPSAARISLLSREGPWETQTSLRTACGERALNCLGPNLHKLLGHSLAMVLVGTCQLHPTEGPLWLSRHLRNTLFRKR